jgi:hypothetical protein
VTALHPNVEPLAAFIGTWRGEGAGDYPTIDAFAYGEELRFWHVGKPHLLYAQRTWALDDERPLHSEMGYWRPLPGGILEVTMAQPTGHVEIEAGTYAGGVVELETTSVDRTPTAKEVAALRRHFVLDGDSLVYDLWMAAVGRPLTHHLRAELQRLAQ